MGTELLAVSLILWLAALNGRPEAQVLSTTAVTVPEISAYAEFDLELDDRLNLCVVLSGVRQGTKNNDVYFRKVAVGKTKSVNDLVRLSEQGHANRGPSLEIGNDTLHCAWLSYNEDTGLAQVAYRRSVNRGTEWGPVRTFSVGRSRMRYPTVVAQQDLIFIVGSNQEQGEPEKLYLFRSEDSGQTWDSVDVNFPDRKGEGATSPQLFVDAKGTAYLFWLDSSPGARAVVFRRSDDRGQSWSTPVTINDDLRNPASKLAACVTGNNAYVSWILAGSYESWIFSDKSTDGGKTWGQDELVYREKVTHLTGKLLCINDNVLLAWSSFWNQVVKRGDSLSYKWKPGAGDWLPPGEAYLSLYGDEKKLSHFKEFEIMSLASKRTVAVFTEVVDEKAAVYASLTSNPAKGFTTAFSISRREPGFEFRLPKIKQVDRTTFVVLYRKVRVKRFDIDPVPATGELLMSLVKTSG